MFQQKNPGALAGATGDEKLSHANAASFSILQKADLKSNPTQYVSNTFFGSVPQCAMVFAVNQSRSVFSGFQAWGKNSARWGWSAKCCSMHAKKLSIIAGGAGNG
ncbi:hypothetical protein [Sulfitobacter sp. AS59]|uniref:hypothetical protein n=1 Tax=Sulfitobacter sp. AS59 TaxID=3135784 RepID=UPI00316C0B88